MFSCVKSEWKNLFCWTFTQNENGIPIGSYFMFEIDRAYDQSIDASNDVVRNEMNFYFCSSFLYFSLTFQFMFILACFDATFSCFVWALGYDYGRKGSSPYLCSVSFFYLLILLIIHLFSKRYVKCNRNRNSNGGGGGVNSNHKCVDYSTTWYSKLSTLRNYDYGDYLLVCFPSICCYCFCCCYHRCFRFFMNVCV